MWLILSIVSEMFDVIYLSSNTFMRQTAINNANSNRSEFLFRETADSLITAATHRRLL